MKKAALWLCLISLLAGCKAPVSIPLREDHPAYGFYQTANAFYVAGSSCTKIGGSLEIRHDAFGPEGAYEKIRELAPGLFIVRDKKTGDEWVSVYFLEYAMAAGIPKICSWNAAQYPPGDADGKRNYN